MAALPLEPRPEALLLAAEDLVVLADPVLVDFSLRCRFGPPEAADALFS